MSIVGTRPPLIGEVSEYELHHRARLAIKPGITGMWQVSGRSDITDFEEVVELDKEYIENWNIESLFTEHTEYVESEPEYAFRAYIGYIIDYQRDLKKALHFYLLHKNEMKDEIVRELWESELMMCTNSFNNPDEFVSLPFSFLH